MTIYDRNSIRLHHGDCLSVMPTLGVQVDSIITDPPYGLEFMGKEWDAPWQVSTSSALFGKRKTAMPGWGCTRNPTCKSCGGRLRGKKKCDCDSPKWDESVVTTRIRQMSAFQDWCTEWAEACLQVTKPGGFLLAFGGTRTFHRLTCAIEDAGWEIRDCIMWVYGSGFPKSLDISKAIDKAAGNFDLDAQKADLSIHIRECREKAGFSRSTLASWFPQYSAVTQNWERRDSGNRTPSITDYEVLIERIGCSKKYRHLLVRAEAEREVVGTSSNGLAPNWVADGNAGFKAEYDLTVPATEAAKLWHGYGTALKPAWEPIIVAMKPLDGTFAENAQRHGVAGLAIDACRIPTDPAIDDSRLGGNGTFGTANAAKNVYEGGYTGNRVGSSPLGRFPANLIHDGSDEVLAGFPQRVGMSGGGAVDNRKTGNESIPDFNRKPSAPFIRGDDGSAARFFYCAKASRSERGKTNTHPTVKPLALMRYLCRLTKTPTGGIVLDPFAGSGSTLIAASLEGREAIGIEQDEANCRIAIERFGEQFSKERQRELIPA